MVNFYTVSLDMLNNQLLPETLKLIDNYPIVFQANGAKNKKNTLIYAPENKIDGNTCLIDAAESADVFEAYKAGAKAGGKVENKVNHSAPSIQLLLSNLVSDSFGTYTVGNPDKILVQAVYSKKQFDYFGCVHLMPWDPKLEYKISGAQASLFVASVIAQCIRKYRNQQVEWDRFKGENLLAAMRDYNQRKK